MVNALGITQEGLRTALKIKDRYRKREPLVLPGAEDRMLIPENLMNHNIDLRGFEDPLPLAQVTVQAPPPYSKRGQRTLRGAHALDSLHVTTSEVAIRPSRSISSHAEKLEPESHATMQSCSQSSSSS